MWCCYEPAFADYYSDEDLDNKWIRKRRRSCVNFTSQQTALLNELHGFSSFLAGLYCVFLVLITSQLEYLLPLPLANQYLIDQHVAGEILRSHCKFRHSDIPPSAISLFVFSPIHQFVLSLCLDSTISPFGHSAIPHFRHSTISAFDHSAIPLFNHPAFFRFCHFAIPLLHLSTISTLLHFAILPFNHPAIPPFRSLPFPPFHHPANLVFRHSTIP